MATSKNENRARRIIVGKELKKLSDILEKYQWNVDTNKLSMLMSMIYYPDYSVRFKPFILEKDQPNKLVGIQFTYPNEDIEVQFTDKASDYVNSFENDKDRYQKWINEESNELVKEIINGLAEQLDIRDNLQKLWNYFETFEMRPIQFALQDYVNVYADYAADEVKENEGVSKMLGAYKLVFGEKSEEYKTFLEMVKKRTNKKNIKGVF